MKGLRAGLTGVLAPDYNVGIFNGVAYKAGGRFPLGAYALYDRKLLGRRCSFRVGVQNFYDLINGSAAYRFDIHLQGDRETVFFDV